MTAGACQGAGLLLDTTDPENPVRVVAVFDFTDTANPHLTHLHH